jgi:hypothetical protein
MATRRAIANGNWSATGTWNGGAVPTDGDTVYANGFNVTINQDILIGGANNPTVNAGSFVSGQWYEVLFVGTTSWTGIGAASNTAGTIFLATGVGSGTGTAKALATLTTAANTPAGATGGGGSFVMSTPYTITPDLRAGTTACLSVTGATALTLDGLRVVAGTSTSAHGCNYAGTTTCTLANVTITGGPNAMGFNNASTGTVTVSGSCTFTSGTGGAGFALNNASTGTVNVSGSCTFTSTGASAGPALNNASTGAVNVSGSCTFTGGAGVALNNASTGAVNVSGSCTFTGGAGFALNNASTGAVNVSGSCTFTGGAGFALNNASAGSVTVTNSTFTASAFTNAVNIVGSTSDVRLSGDFLDHWNGWKAVSGVKWRLGTSPTLSQTRFALAGTTDSYFTMYGADNGSFGNPIAANVRSGVSYGGGNLTGTCAVPAAGSVSLGVPVGSTTGTAVLTAAAIRTELAVELARIDSPISGAGNAPTAVQIRQEMDANSTKLVNLDATVSSRLASSVSTNITAIKAKTDLLNTDRLAQCATTSIVGSLIAQSNS